MTREETIEKLQSIIEENKNSLIPRVHVGLLIHAVKYLKEQPEIVSCKDCKHFEPEGIYTMCYRHNGLSQNADLYCADGEHKEGL